MGSPGLLVGVSDSFVQFDHLGLVLNCVIFCI